jgi:hypothetical protein
MPAPPSVNRSLGAEIGCFPVILVVIWFVLAGIFYAVHLVPLAVILDILAPLGIVAWIIFAIKRYTDEKSSVDTQKRLWPAMERVWNDLYYCFRDDIVFCGSAPSEFASSSGMRAFLVQQAS